MINKIRDAISKLLENDSYLLEVDSSERSIAHRLAIYLEEIFADWDVDCEYNRNIYDCPTNNDKSNIYKLVKRFHNNCTENDCKCNGYGVFPDIIIHKRNSENNFIVIELKKDINTDLENKCIKKIDCKCDLCKLKEFKTLEIFKYEYAFFIVFPTGEKAKGISIESINITPIDSI